MTHLRQKLEADPSNPKHLKTDTGIGYRLLED
jgi:two-component system KDP operon response regulator KdpE